MNRKSTDVRSILNHLGRRDDWYRIVNAAGAGDEPAEVFIYDEIGYFGTTASEFVSELKDVDADEILVRISSIGGSVFDGIAIYNALRTHDAHVTTRVESMAASIASVIAQAGDLRVMVTGSQMMIHDASGIAIGDAATMREMADILERQSDVIANIYAERSAGDADSFRSMMANETWMTADEAVEEGLADEVYRPAVKDNGDGNDAPPAEDRLSSWSKFIESADVH